MKKLIVSLLVVLMLVLTPISVLATSFGVSPGSVELDVPKDGSTTQAFTFTGYTGTVIIGLEDIPLSITPSGSIEVTDGETVVVTFFGDGTNNTYEGYITFLASTGETALVGIKVGLTVHVNLTAEVVTPTPSGGGGDGGGSGGAGYIIRTDFFGEEKFHYTDNDGQLLGNINATSQDGKLGITIPRETLALEEDGKRLKTLGALINENPPAPPDDANIIGLPYDFSPAGATFEPPITFTWTYDPDALPEGAVEGELTLAYYLDGEWVELECVVDIENNIVTASVSHFTTFALMIEMPKPILPVEVIAPTPIPSPTPAPPTPAPVPPVITPVPAPTSPPEIPKAPAPPSVSPAVPVNYTVPIVIIIISFIVLAFVVWLLWYRARENRHNKYGENSD